MNINNDYQKLRGLKKSFPNGEIIELNRKFLEINSFYPLSDLFYSTYLERYREIIYIKKDPKMGSLRV